VRVCGYLAAVLPGLSIYVCSHVPILRLTPLALSFVLMAAIARNFGRGPSIAAPIVTTICFNYIVAKPENAWASNVDGIVQTLIILGLGSLIVSLFQGQQKAEKSLRAANAALQERSNALSQAQQGSNSAAWTFHTTTRRTAWYEGGSELFGRSLAEITAMGSPTNLVLEEDRPKVAAAAAHTARTGEPARFDGWRRGVRHSLRSLTSGWA
jgi:K+-sensing histidine kinase KdpD